MYWNKVLAIVAGLFLFPTTIYGLSFADVDSITVSNPVLKSSSGSTISSVKPGQQVQILVTIENNEATSQSFTAVIELRDTAGVTLNLQWQSGILSPNTMKEVGISWVANIDEPTELTARAFVISSIESPEILSSISTSSFSIVIETENEDISDYTILAYIVGSDLESDNYTATIDIAEMALVGSTDYVNVVMETGGSHAPVDDYRFIDFREVQTHLILEDEFLTLENFGEKNMGDPQTLTDFIVWGVSQFPAEKYAIILWDHGNGINGFGYDEIYEDSLTLNELEIAFADAKSATDVDFELIGFDACLMATIEVANRLSPYGNFLVASEELEPGWGWDYTAILSSLVEDPGQTGNELGKTIADSYVEHAKANAELYQDYESQRTVTLSVIDLEAIPLLHQRIMLLAESLDDQVVSFDSSYLLARAVDNTERYGVGARSSSGHVDLYHLATNVEEEFPGYHQQVDDLQNAISDAVVYNVNGEAKPNANGISIYIPLDSEEFRDDYILYSLSGWSDLLDSQQIALDSDTEAPEVNLDFDGETISGSIEGNDISEVILYISSETYDDTRVEVLSYLELEPSWIVEADGSIKFAWDQQIISLCNEEFCTPTLMDIEVSGDTVFALFPVRLEAEDVNEDVTLVYEVNVDDVGNTVFEFLGAWPEIDDEGTVARELWPLYVGDNIYTYTFEYDLEDEDYFSYVEYEPIVVTENFQPEYFTYTGTYYLSIGVCDYSDNCSYSNEFQFVTGQESEAEDIPSYESGNLDISLWFEDPIVRGNIQTITAQVYDEFTEYVIEDAYVEVDVIYASGQTTKDFVGYTDGNGEVSFSWRIGGNSTPGTFEVFIEVRAEGYETEYYSSSFEVIPAS